MGHDLNDALGTVKTVPAVVPTCDYCSADLPRPRNHNGIVPRFCNARCRGAWHAQEKRRVLERAREALQAALAAVDALLARRG